VVSVALRRRSSPHLSLRFLPELRHESGCLVFGGPARRNPFERGSYRIDLADLFGSWPPHGGGPVRAADQQPFRSSWINASRMGERLTIAPAQRVLMQRLPRLQRAIKDRIAKNIRTARPRRRGREAARSFACPQCGCRQDTYVVCSVNSGFRTVFIYGSDISDGFWHQMMALGIKKYRYPRGRVVTIGLCCSAE